MSNTFSLYLDGVWQMEIVTDKSEDEMQSEWSALHPGKNACVWSDYEEDE